MIARRHFLAKAAAASVAPLALAAAPAPPHDYLDRALVLSGGGARGAYEAGIIWKLAQNAGISDGRRLPPYDFVCGTSIGALNGWFVATAQYSRLYELWHTIAAQNVIQLEPKFAKMTEPSAGVASRLASALRLASLAKNEQGVAQGAPLLAFLKREIDPNAPLVMPLVWAVTDLNTQQPEYFFRVRSDATGPPPEFIFKALRITVGPTVSVREAQNDLLHRALQASISIPFVFDPVNLPSPANDGTTRQYVDGGVASNSPVSIARTVAKGVDIILLDPKLEVENLPSAVDVGLSSFGTMQRKLLESELRQTYFQSLAKRGIDRLGPSAVAQLANYDPLLATFLADLPVTELAYLRPKNELAVRVGGFDDQVLIDEAFQLGVDDADRGFKPYDYDTFEY
jgi:predicted acylesterase/phospholipase RssA